MRPRREGAVFLGVAVDGEIQKIDTDAAVVAGCGAVLRRDMTAQPWPISVLWIKNDRICRFVE